MVDESYSVAGVGFSRGTIPWVIFIILIQDDRLAPAYFSPNHKYFDQLLQTVKNKTTVLILVFEELVQTSVPPLISVLYAKGYHDYPLKNFCLTVPKKIRRGTLLCFTKVQVSKKIMDKRGGGKERVSRFSVKIFLPHSAEKFCWGNSVLYFKIFPIAKKIMDMGGGV